MILVNFSHPLNAEQRAQIERLVGREIDRVIEVRVHFDQGRSFVEQVHELIGGVGLSSPWGWRRAIIIPPSLNTIAVTLLAELHGRMGYFPPIVRMRPVEGVLPPRFEAAEIIDLQQVYDVGVDSMVRGVRDE
jgi:hypothetical protein